MGKEIFRAAKYSKVAKAVFQKSGGTCPSHKWKTWLADFKTYLISSNITDKKGQRTLLLYQAGQRVREIFRQLPDTGEDDAFDTAVTKLTSYFEPQKNKLFEVYAFRKAVQGPNETLDQFHTRLRTLAESCEFHDLEFEIQVQIVIGGRATRLRKQALRGPKYTLKDMLLETRRAKTNAQQAADKKGQLSNQTVKTVRKYSTPQSSWNTNFPPRKSCFKCGGPFPHKGHPCPAKQQTCRKCGATGHFEKCCKGKQPTRFRPKSEKETIRGITQNESADIDNKSDNEIISDSSDDYLYAIHTADPKHPEVFVKVKCSKFKVTVDTGSTIDVIDQDTFKKLQGIKLKSTNVKAYPYNFDKPVEMAGNLMLWWRPNEDILLQLFMLPGTVVAAFLARKRLKNWDSSACI